MKRALLQNIYRFFVYTILISSFSFAGNVSAQTVNGTLKDSLSKDINLDGIANPGDSLRYKATIKNTGPGPANTVNYNNPTPNNTTLGTGTVKTSPLARNDAGATVFNSALPAFNVLTNDFGVPMPTIVVTFGPTANPAATLAGGTGTSNGGGTVSVSAAGAVTYTPALNYTGIDQFAYIASNGNAPNNSATMSITVGDPAIAVNDAYNVIGNVSIGSNVKTNDLGDGTTVTAVNGVPGNVGIGITTAGGANLTLNANGTFTYNPLAGFEGSDNFTYTINNGFNAPSTATVTLTISGMIWFVDNSQGVNGNGRLTTPFNNLASFASINNGTGNNPATGDNIFIFTGAGNYTGGVTLLSNQKLIGANAQTTLAAITGYTVPAYSTPLPPTLLAAPNIANAGGIGVTLNSAATGNLLNGFSVQDCSGSAVSGSGFGTVTVTNLSINNTTGQGLSLTNGAISGNFNSINSNAGTNNVALNNCTGTTTISGNLQGATGASFLINGGSVIVNKTGNITQSNNAAMVNVTGGHTGTLTFSSGTLSATNGTGLQFDNADGTYNFNGTNTMNGAAASIAIFNGSGGTFNFSSNTSITNPNGGPAVNIIGGTAAVTYSGSITMSTQNQPLVSVSGGHATGTVTFNTGTLDATSGTGLQFDNADGIYNFNALANLHGGDAGIDILNGSAGNFTFLNTPITNPSGSTIYINSASSATVNHTGAISSNAAGVTSVSITQNSGSNITLNSSISITGNSAIGIAVSSNLSANNVTFAGNLSYSGTGSAVVINSNVFGGSITFSGISKVFSSNSVVVSIVGNNASVPITFSNGGLAITATGGTGFHISGSVVSVTGPGNTISATGGPAALNHLGGQIGLGGMNFQNVSANGTVNGISLNNVTNNLTVSGGSITGVSGAAINVTGGSVSMTYSGSASQATAAQPLINVSGGHATGTITFNTGTLSATNGTGLQFDNADGNYNFNGTTILNGGSAAVNIINGSGGIFTFASTTTITSPADTAFNILGGTTIVAYNGNITQSNVSSFPMVCVSQGHATGTILFQSGTLNATTGTGLQFDNADGGYNFSGTTTLNGGDAGIDILNGSTGTFTFGTSTSITRANGVSGAAFNLLSSDANVTYNGSMSLGTSTGNMVSINNHDAGTMNFNLGNLTKGSSTTQGISITNCNAGTINFNNPNITIAMTSGNAISLTTNTGSNINFTPAAGVGVVLTTTSGIGFNATGGGTITVTGSSNTISSTTGTALNVANTTIGVSDLIFQSISAGTGAGSAGLGINVVNTGSVGGLHITGTGAVGSGGTIQHKTGADNSVVGGIGIYLDNTMDVQLNRMQLNDFDNYAIRCFTVTGFQLTNTTINGTNGTSILGTVDPISGGSGEGSVLFHNLLGTGTITGCGIGGGFNNIVRSASTSGTLDRLFIDNTTIGDLDGAGPGFGVSVNGNDGLVFTAENTGTVANLSITNCIFNSSRGDLIQTDARFVAAASGAHPDLDVVLQGNTFSNIHPNMVIGGGGLTIGGLGNVTYDISNNVFNMTNVLGYPLNVFDFHDAVGTPGPNTFAGRIFTNTVNGSTAATAINLDAQGRGQHTTLIQNNTSTNYGESGVRINTVDNNNTAATLNAVIVGNTASSPAPAGFSGIYVVAGADPVTDDFQITNLQLGGGGTFKNNFSAGDPFNANDIYLANAAGNLNLSQGNSASAVVATVITDNNTPPVTTIFTDATPSGNTNVTAPIVVRLIANGISVKEDGTAVITYTFLRWGNTQAALTVNFSVGGTAVFGTDYTQSGAATFGAGSGTITFAAGSPVATITIDPTADGIVEATEAVILTITAGGYTIGTPNTVTTRILNDD